MLDQTAFPHLALNPELRSAVRSLTARFDTTYWDEHDSEHEFPQEFFDAFVEAGFMGALIPEEYGGGGGTTLEMVTILEEVAASGGGLNACSSVHVPLICTPTILAFGTDAQRTELLPKIVAGKMYITFGVTEPDAGTDTTKVRTKATKVDGGWTINGSKVWNTGALRGDKSLVLVRTSEPNGDQRPAHGLTLVLVDLKDQPTIDIRPIPKIGRNAVASCEVFFNNHLVRDEDVVGTVDRGFYHLLHSLNSERLFVAAESIGLGRWVVDAATSYAKERVVFGRQIGQNQAVQHPLAKSYMEVMAAAQVVYDGVAQYEEKGGEAIGAIANSAKYLASEAVYSAADAAMQVFGGFAYAREYHIGRHWIEARLQRLAPINNQMVLNYIAERALGLPRSY